VCRPGETPGGIPGQQQEGKVSVVNLGPTELIIILLIVMLLFGAARLPKLAKSLGESAKEFRNAQSAISEAGGPQENK